jgi:hypothetical protein
MARKPVDLQKQKEAKQKKVLLVLAPVFLGLVAWQGPKTFQAFTGGAEAAPAPTPPAATAATPPTATAPSTATTTTTAASGLPDTDAPLAPLDGQLVSFSRFEGVDPFRPKDSKPGTQVDTSDDSAAAQQGALLEVNGQSENISLGGRFPASDPVFVLKAIGDQKVDVGLVSGASFSDGKAVQSINVGETLTLVADPDGTTYTIKLISIAA